MPEMKRFKIHISYAKREQQIAALRAQALLAVSGIRCSIDQDKKPGRSWERVYILENGGVDCHVPPFALVAHICRMIEALLALKEYGEKLDAAS